MAKQKRYIFNQLTQNFEVLETSKSRKVLRFLLVMLALLGVAFLFAVLLFTFFKSPKEKSQARELEYMKLQYEILNDRLDNIEILLTDMEQRDNDLYRVMFEADPIPRQVRRSGFSDADRYAGLYGYINSNQVVSAARKLDVISSQLYHQSVSYDTLFAMARNKSDMLAHIPAIFPLKETEIKYISSYFGYRPDPIYKVEKLHTGIDFSAQMGTEAYATGDGVVSDVEKGHWGYGNMVTIDHGYGYKTRYAHLQKAAVRKGQRMKRGQLIGFIGNTGKTTGVHLHYEVLKNDVPINPINFFYNDLTPDEYEQILEQSTLPTQTMD
ncbi:MAG: M23 family metallopeptidase [Bacteroidales bacterium]|nr:M23 family metallopeptidase [Bacteroidales bacterium]